MNPRGFTMFFAVLVASLALSVGLAIYDLTVRQLALASTITESQYAIYAADTGAECALYWDAKYQGTQSLFATSSQSSPPSSGALCASQDIVHGGTWGVVTAASAATTTFTITFPGTTRCTTVTVAKYVVNNSTHTTITAHGYNICATGAANQLERVFQVTY